MKKTKEERQAWWRSLTPEQQTECLHKWERSREKTTVKKAVKKPKPLTHQQMRAINANMRRIGLERFIVLPD